MPNKAVAVTYHDLLIKNSSQNPEYAILHLIYDKIDDRNHKTLTNLSHMLSDAGFHDLSLIVSHQIPFATYIRASEALKAREFILEHSAAVHPTLYYKGHFDHDAGNLIQKENHIKDNIFHH